MIVFVLIILILLFAVFSVLIVILIDRKILASVQGREGPSVTGFFGVLQTAADGFKVFLKTQLPGRSVVKVFLFGLPIVLFIISLFNWIFIPVGDLSSVVDFRYDMLVVYIFFGLGVLVLTAAAWAAIASRYPALGLLREIAQMAAYEVIFGVVLVSVELYSSGLSLRDSVEAQSGVWFVFLLLPFASLFFFISCATLHRTPFDLAESESELTAGYQTEHGGTSFSMFFLEEYSNLLVFSVLTVLLFFGGWYIPLGFKSDFFASFKYAVMSLIFVVVRSASPRTRISNFLISGWSILVPSSSSLLTTYIVFCYVFCAACQDVSPLAGDSLVLTIVYRLCFTGISLWLLLAPRRECSDLPQIGNAMSYYDQRITEPGSKRLNTNQLFRAFPPYPEKPSFALTGRTVAAFSRWSRYLLGPDVKSSFPVDFNAQYKEQEVAERLALFYNLVDTYFTGHGLTSAHINPGINDTRNVLEGQDLDYFVHRPGRLPLFDRSPHVLRFASNNHMLKDYGRFRQTMDHVGGLLNNIGLNFGSHMVTNSWQNNWDSLRLLKNFLTHLALEHYTELSLDPDTNGVLGNSANLHRQIWFMSQIKKMVALSQLTPRSPRAQAIINSPYLSDEDKIRLLLLDGDNIEFLRRLLSDDMTVYFGGMAEFKNDIWRTKMGVISLIIGGFLRQLGFYFNEEACKQIFFPILFGRSALDPSINKLSIDRIGKDLSEVIYKSAYRRITDEELVQDHLLDLAVILRARRDLRFFRDPRILKEWYRHNWMWDVVNNRPESTKLEKMDWDRFLHSQVPERKIKRSPRA